MKSMYRFSRLALVLAMVAIGMGFVGCDKYEKPSNANTLSLDRTLSPLLDMDTTQMRDFLDKYICLRDFSKPEMDGFTKKWEKIQVSTLSCKPMSFFPSIPMFQVTQGLTKNRVDKMEISVLYNGKLSSSPISPEFFKWLRALVDWDSDTVNMVQFSGSIFIPPAPPISKVKVYLTPKLPGVIRDAKLDSSLTAMQAVYQQGLQQKQQQMVLNYIILGTKYQMVLVLNSKMNKTDLETSWTITLINKKE